MTLTRSPALIRSAGPWTAVAATSRGSLHERRGRPNQDAVKVAQLPPPHRGLVAAVADGHGGPQYVRSDVGARRAVDVACAVLGELLPAGTGVPAAELRALAETRMASALVERWWRAVAEHAAADPFTDAEQALLGGAGTACAYGSTVLAAAVWEGGVLLLKLGDGDVLAVGVDGSAWSPVADDARLVAGVTTSLCLPGAAADVRVAVLPPGPVAVLVLATDGYGASFASPAWRQQVMGDLLQAVRTHGPDEVAKALPGWLAESAATAGDDASVAVVSHLGDGV